VSSNQRAAHKIDHAFGGRDVLVLPEASAVGANATSRLDGSRLEDDKASASQSKLTKVYKMPVIVKAVLRAVLAPGRKRKG